MATWEDGPEYAPRERPQSFALPEAAPLETVPPPLPPTAEAPAERPHFDQPAAPVAELVTLLPAPAAVRDPQQPFDVATSSLTSDSAWGSAHGQLPAPPAAAPPAAAPVAVDPFQAPIWAPDPPADTGFPAPGTPGWFAPPPAYGPPPAPARVDAKAVVQAVTPGICICLAVGVLFSALAPVMLGVTALLSTRVRVEQGSARIASRAALALMSVVAMTGLFSDTAVIVGWWTFVGQWSRVICFVLLAVLLVLVWRGLTRAAGRPPSPSRWG